MNGAERYEDPGLAGRLRDYLHDAATPAAPERLVFAVMDDVQRYPRLRGFLGRPGRGLLSGAARYAVLTAVITVGVAAGISLSQRVQGPGQTPSQLIPSGGPSFSPGSGSVVLPLDGLTVEAAESSLWVATGEGQLIELAADSGAELRRVDIGIRATDMAVRPSQAGRADSFGSGDTIWLVEPTSNMVYVDAGVGQTNAILGTAGARVAIGMEAVWVGREGAILRVEPLAAGVTLTLDVPAGHADDDPVLAAGDAIWIADDAAIRRLDPATGSETGAVPGGARSLTTLRGLVIAAGGDDVLAIDPGTLRIQWRTPEPRLTSVAGAGDRLWAIADVDGAVALVEIDIGTGAVISRTSLPDRAIAVAAGAGFVWTLDERGVVRRVLARP